MIWLMLVEKNNGNAELICWSEDGEYLLIKNVQKLTKELLPSHFKHSNLSSFIRQVS